MFTLILYINTGDNHRGKYALFSMVASFPADQIKLEDYAVDFRSDLRHRRRFASPLKRSLTTSKCLHMQPTDLPSMPGRIRRSSY